MDRNYRPGFTYQEFAKDFTAELFNADEWADLFQKSGAKYVVLTSKHHDGFALWPSTYSFSWNAVDLGPHRDIIGESPFFQLTQILTFFSVDDLSKAIRRKTGLKFGLYYSLFEWFNRMYLKDKHGSFKQREYAKYKMWPELKELINRYRPEVLWSDGDWEAEEDYWKSKEFIAWLYNDSPVNETVVTNDRWGIGVLCKHGDFITCSDRYNPGVLQERKWENAFTLDRTSWGHRESSNFSEYMTTQEVIKEIVTTVSCGGNVLINVGPTKAGTIDAIFQERLLDMGKWLKVNGEAIYESKPFEFQNDTKTPDVWYTAGGSNGLKIETYYAMLLTYPTDSLEVELFSLRDHVKPDAQVELLGYNSEIKWRKSDETLVVALPNRQELGDLDWAWTLKITNFL
jgi:alpha-L-fucosidase